MWNYCLSSFSYHPIKSLDGRGKEPYIPTSCSELQTNLLLLSQFSVYCPKKTVVSFPSYFFPSKFDQLSILKLLPPTLVETPKTRYYRQSLSSSLSLHIYTNHHKSPPIPQTSALIIAVRAAHQVTRATFSGPLVLYIAFHASECCLQSASYCRGS